ncbi:MAG: hypothetical protein Q7U57_01740 [Methylovulum sp.]|nr:hypothetical protein [Methylovulum sp.]
MNTTLHISLPETLKQYVKERVDEEHFSNPSDYIRVLIREDQKRRDEKKLEQMLLEGLTSGQGIISGTPDWNNFWEKLQARAESQRK